MPQTCVQIYVWAIFRLYNNPAESGEGVRCSTLSRLSQQHSSSTSRKSLMNSSGAFLHNSPPTSDIEDQSRARGDPAVFNPYYDKNCQDNDDRDSSQHPPPPLSNSQITSELIHHLLKLRSVAAAGNQSERIDECSGGVGSHINSCLDDSDYHTHSNEESRGALTSSPQCDEDDKLFIL